MDNPWAKLIDEISSPWDIVFAIGGGAVGAVGTVAAHGAELGTAAASGALTGVACRRAYIAATRKRKALRRAEGLAKTLEKRADGGLKPPEMAHIRQLQETLSKAKELLERKAMPVEASDLTLNELVTEFMKPSAEV